MDIDRIAIVGDKPAYSPYGYLVSEDGTIYSLTAQYTHGTLLALLFPEIANEQGYDIPDEDYCVYHYQKFELDNHEKFPILRVSISMMLKGMLNISKGDSGATDKQMTALSLILRVQGVNLNEDVSCDHGIISARKALVELKESDNERRKRNSRDAAQFRDET